MLGLVASILEPNLHLGFGELQRARQLGAICTNQVALTTELALQLEHLKYHTRRYVKRFLLNCTTKLRQDHCMVVPAFANWGQRG